MVISIIVAIANNWVIGCKNALPWHLPADLKHFHQLTAGKPVIMGQKTFESIGKPLPGRTNIIITLDNNYAIPGCLVVHSVGESLEAAKGFEEVMIIGGASIYKQFLPLADRLYLTLIEADIAGADAFFPEINYSEWNEVERVKNEPDKENPYPYTFLTLERRR
ncbi:MAG: dihydrofolate reductase [bacterium]|nr:dihydrofolate reductase [bacterium]